MVLIKVIKLLLVLKKRKLKKIEYYYCLFRVIESKKGEFN